LPKPGTGWGNNEHTNPRQSMKELMAKIDTLEEMEGVRRAMRAAGVHVKARPANTPQ